MLLACRVRHAGRGCSAPGCRPLTVQFDGLPPDESSVGTGH